MTNSQDTYRKIVKTTGLFGGVQLVNMLVSLIRNKVIATLLGAEGIGIIGVFNTSIEMVSSVTGIGLRQSGVKDVSVAAKSSNDRLSQVVSVLRGLSMFAGLLGAFAMLCLSPLLSRATFGNDTHIWGFVLLSCALFFNALSSGDQAVLQGTGRLKPLAKSTVAGSIASLAVSIPMYYYFGIVGIAPSLIIASLFTFIFTIIFLRRDGKKYRRTAIPKAIKEGRPMVRLGIFMTISGFITTLLNYILIAWLNRNSSIIEVGYYQAGFTLVTRYVGLVFAAMSTEYYPRLAAINTDNRAVSLNVSRQMETSLLLLLPLAVGFIIFQEWILKLLYTLEFICVAAYTGWAMTGVLFKAISWPLGFVLLAKGEGRLFFITELLSDVTSFAVNIVLYQTMGLEGLGIGYTLNFALYAAFMWLLCRRLYKFAPERRMYVVSTIAVTLTFSVLALIHINTATSYSIASILFATSLTYSYLLLKKRLKKS